MSRMKVRVLFAAFAASLLTAAPADAAGGLVVRSAGPSAKLYPPGKSLPENAPVVLKAGDALTVLASGGARVLRGPGTFSLGAARSLASASFNPRARFGAMRTGEVPMSPSLWDVDVSQSGNVCLADPKSVTLWRPEHEEGVTLGVKKADGSGESLPWDAGQATLPWPAKVPIAEGAEYLVSWTGNDDPTRLKFYSLAEVPADLATLAKTLIDKGCQTQLDMLVDTTPAEAATP